MSHPTRFDSALVITARIILLFHRQQDISRISEPIQVLHAELRAVYRYGVAAVLVAESYEREFWRVDVVVTQLVRALDHLVYVVLKEGVYLPVVRDIAINLEKWALLQSFQTSLVLVLIF